MNDDLIAYPARDIDGHQNIFLVHKDGTTPIKSQLTFGPDNALPSWSPDGLTLAYTARDPRLRRRFILYDERGWQHPLGEGTSPKWSHDGRLIVFSTAQETTTPSDIAIMNADGSGRRIITKSSRSARRDFPCFSPDDSRIVYSEITPSTPPHVTCWIVDVKGVGKPFQLTIGRFVNVDTVGKPINTAFDSGSPHWSIDDWIAFWSGVENEQGQVWKIRPNGKDRKQLTFTRENNDDPRWSPDGKELLFSTSQNKGMLGIMNADGSNVRLITANTAGPMPGDASWQPKL